MMEEERCPYRMESKAGEIMCFDPWLAEYIKPPARSSKSGAAARVSVTAPAISPTGKIPSPECADTSCCASPAACAWRITN